MAIKNEYNMRRLEVGDKINIVFGGRTIKLEVAYTSQDFSENESLDIFVSYKDREFLFVAKTGQRGGQETLASGGVFSLFERNEEGDWNHLNLSARIRGYYIN